MMGAGYMDNNQAYSDWFYRRCVGWELKFALWPRRCFISGNLIWFKRGYQGMSMLTGPGDTIIDYRWHDVDEHLIWKIKGN